jgi:hypothetical protein
MKATLTEKFSFRDLRRPFQMFDLPNNDGEKSDLRAIGVDVSWPTGSLS